MKFWSNVEKEYKSLFGDEEDKNEDKAPENSKMETDFDNIITEIKEDLKKVSKDDVLPGISTFPGGSDFEDEDKESDVEDEKASNTGSSKKQSKRKCKIGNKSYSVGERWKDPKTGKDMICILMSIPKDVQPKLSEADVTITQAEDRTEHGDPELKPKTTGPQWAYTNKQPKGRGCSSDKESEKPDQVGSEAEVDETSSRQEQQPDDVDNEMKPFEEGDLLDNKVEIDDETQEDKTAEDAGNLTEHSEKDSDTRGNGNKESDNYSEERILNNGQSSEKLEDSGSIKGKEDESESDTDSEEEKRRRDKEAEAAEADDESEYEEREEDKVKHETENDKFDVRVTPDDRETAVVRTDEDENYSDANENHPEDGNGSREKEEEGVASKSDVPEEIPTIRENGKAIYTKETTVTQRKLFKTVETLESVETERNVA